MRDDPTELLNFVANQPEVIKEMAPGYAWVDLKAFFSRPGNFMFGDDRGVVLFAHHGDGVYELHYMFSCALRGPKAMRVVRAAIKTMFTLHNASAICGATPRDNLPARLVNRALGACPIGVSTDSNGRPCINYMLERAKWATLSVD